MIEAVGLTKRFGAKTAVDALSFQVKPGHVTGFLGPNGSGKSTTMRMILGLDRPTSGHVTINGQPFRELPNAQRHVGALLDAKAMHGGRRARTHLLALAKLSGIPEKRVDEVLGVVGLQEVARQRTKGFSLGMGQRLGIAAALLGDPQVLLFDEPVNGLDPEGILWVRNLMRHLASEGRTVFVSSHLMSEMALTADHLIVIGRGRLLSDMSTHDFITHNSAGFARVRAAEDAPGTTGARTGRSLLGTALTKAGGRVLQEPGGALRVTGLELPRISDLAHEAGVRLWELSPHRASLEEAYMRMTQSSVEYTSTEDPRAELWEPEPLALPEWEEETAPEVPSETAASFFAPPPPAAGGRPFLMPGSPAELAAPAAGTPAAAPAETAPAGSAPAEVGASAGKTAEKTPEDPR
ncbi:ABC transporter ATP-binding protein [Streptomyces sp. NBC_00249]|uniref:ABC transporter ATP-binding protein n=1 Tax=Streptomyces sp. NBC_00249 TaxID=2975690 RepID=UPI00225871EE|nr:ABC transporter ATP-binding protein [Streptomyces sp. NBC_00249]MCX5194330.1 ABC transporter ATP-binding protein [Streptomyces sp. NBC_00249]